jgi:hypothetical protein
MLLIHRYNTPFLTGPDNGSDNGGVNDDDKVEK